MAVYNNLPAPAQGDYEMIGWGSSMSSPPIVRKWGRPAGGSWTVSASSATDVSLDFLVLSSVVGAGTITVTTKKACHVWGVFINNTASEVIDADYSAGATVFSRTPGNPGYIGGHLYAK